MPLLWICLLLGIIEGLTEFLPISSTGHLIIFSAIVGFEGEKAEVFQVFIQLGAILSVVWEFRDRLFRVAVDLPHRKEARSFVANLLIAFLPAAVIGLLIYDFISDYLFSPGTVASALITGAMLILLVEAQPRPSRTHRAEDVTWKQALTIGVAQCLALWPGFSRSTATIMGGLVSGLDRRAATEFSFFLAIPTMFAATFYSLFENIDLLEPSDWGGLSLAFVVSFLVAWGSIRWLLRYVSTHSFAVFAWYRLAVGALVLVLMHKRLL